ncbi:PKD domain-containing protein [uncultured Methanoregula sp.]|uniref:PKD domain-containing protein n=1 Tax=uncultured Methanoregula sp. TaxID=1005933 RepID=UPI002AAB8B81|nr:PKD domain-containing protein [uncultured Methanoregula sp.]
MTTKTGYFSGWHLAVLVLLLMMVIAIVPAMASSAYATSAWPKFGYDLNNTGQSPYAGPQTGNVKWIYQTGGVIGYVGYSIGADGTIYTGSNDKKFYALNPDGTAKWSYTTGNQLVGTPAIAADGTIYEGNLDKNLYAFNPDGTLKWTYATGGAVRGSPSIGSDGTIYVGSFDKIFYAINPDGTLKWKYTAGNYFYWNTPVIGPDGTIYIGNLDSKLYAFNPDGTVKWSYTTGAKIQGSASIGSDGTIYVGSDDFNIYAVNPDGTLKWKYTTGSTVRGSPSIASDGTIYIGNNGDNKLYAIKPDGSLKWSYPVGAIQGSSPAIGSDGTIYVGCSGNSVFFALNPDGSLKWSYTSSQGYSSSPTIGSDGTLYVGNIAGIIYAFHDPAPVTPVAAFTATPLAGAAPLAVTFTDVSTNTPTSWAWDFGDGSTSTEKSPTHTYSNAGLYTVNLTATNSAGSNSLVKSNFVTATGLLPGNRHIFVNVANDAGVKYNIDGSAFSGPNNTYYIKADGGGLNELHLTNDPSVAAGQVTASTAKSGAFYFSNTGGRGFDNDIILMVSVKGPIPDDFAVRIKSSGYNWTAATPGSYNPSAPTDYYYVPGAIDETFTKADFIYGPHVYKPGPGTLGSWSLPLYYGQDTADSSTAEYLMFVDLKAGNLYPTKFTGATLTDGGDVKVEYSFTNLTSMAAFNGYGWCTASNQGQGITWTHPTSGSTASGYTVTPVAVTAPVAAFSASTTSGTAPLAVQFNDTSSNTPASWAWDFGDGSTSTVQNATHTYTTAGTYTVNLTATNAGGSNLVTKTSYITVSGGSSAGSNPFQTVAKGEQVFIGESGLNITGVAPTGTVLSWYASGATVGGTPTNTITIADSSNFAVSQAQFAGYTGTWYVGNPPASGSDVAFTVVDPTIAVSVWDIDQNKDVSGTTVPAGDRLIFRIDTNAYPVTSRSFVSSSNGYIGINLTSEKGDRFTEVYNKSPADGTSKSFDLTKKFSVNSNPWYWGNTLEKYWNTSALESGARMYPDGNYSVGVRLFLNNITDNYKDNGADYRGKTYQVASVTIGPAVTAPVADFIADTRSGTAPLTVQFTDLSTNSPTTGIWDFGDGSAVNATAKNPVHTYANAGTYTVNLSVSNAAGSNSSMKSGYITVSSAPGVPVAPVAAFTASTTAGTAPLAVTFNDTSVNTPTSWLWNFGDGSTSTVQNATHTYTTSGTYAVTLTATNAAGGNSTVKTNYITVKGAGGVLPGYNNIFVGVANDAGARYNTFSNNTYNIRFEGVDRGLNALHISTDPTVNFGQVTSTSSTSGSFYATDSGGKGYEDEVLLMVAVNGTIPDDFRLQITSDGYTWTPNTLSNTAPDLSTVTYQKVALNETFTKADFIYGPQTWKPTGNEVDYPVFYGQNLSDTSNTFRLMFIDLNSGVLRPNTALMNNGAVRINYTIQNPGPLTAFNVYSYCKYSNNGNEMVAWGNALVDPKAVSGYSVYRVAVLPLPGLSSSPTDLNNDGLYEDLNGNAGLDFNDVQLFFRQMDWIAANEPVAMFDFNHNGGIDFNDIQLLFRGI